MDTDWELRWQSVTLSYRTTSQSRPSGRPSCTTSGDPFFGPRMPEPISLCEADITSQLTNQLNLSPWTWPTPANSPTRFMTSLVISCIPIFFHVICLCFSWVQIYFPIFLCLLSLSLHRLILWLVHISLNFLNFWSFSCKVNKLWAMLNMQPHLESNWKLFKIVTNLRVEGQFYYWRILTNRIRF